MKEFSRTIIIAVFLLAIALFGGIYFMTREKPVEGDKTITVLVVNGDSTKTFPISTDSEYLRGALDSIELVAGDESEFGLFIQTVDGYTAKTENQEWWCVTKNGEQVNTGIETTVIADGEQYELTLMVGW